MHVMGFIVTLSHPTNLTSQKCGLKPGVAGKASLCAYVDAVSTDSFINFFQFRKHLLVVPNEKVYGVWRHNL